MAKYKSRSARWMDAVTAAQNAVSDITEAASELDEDALATAVDEFESTMSDLADVRQEYQEWFDNMPEGLRDGATGQKLEEVTNLDVEEPTVSLESVQDAIREAVAELLTDVTDLLSEAESVELPAGFGRD